MYSPGIQLQSGVHNKESSDYSRVWFTRAVLGATGNISVLVVPSTHNYYMISMQSFSDAGTDSIYLVDNDAIRLTGVFRAKRQQWEVPLDFLLVAGKTLYANIATSSGAVCFVFNYAKVPV